MSYIFKCYTDGNREFFQWEADTKHFTTKRPVKKDFELSQSLLDFLDLDMDDYLNIFKKMGACIQKLSISEGVALELRKSLDFISKKHIYFEFLRLQWLDRIDGFTEGKHDLYHKDLTHIPMKIITAQNQVKFMIDKALDNTDGQNKSIQKRVAALYARNSRSAEKAFSFSQIALNFERVDDSAMAEVLRPESIIDIVDYFMREFIRREIGFKVCKNCGKYFPSTGHGNSEYCNRLFQNIGKTCKEIGAVTKWKEKVVQSPAMLLYNKYYKTRFSRIRAGKITCEAFRVWAEQAREKRDAVMRGEIKLDEFESWLKR